MKTQSNSHDFIAVTQLLVYIGGVLVLILFTVMMTRIPAGSKPARGFDRLVPAAVFSMGVFGLLYKTITGTQWATTGMSEALPTTAEIGTNLMTNYIFPFEYVSLVLLAAMIGAAILIREPQEPVATEEKEATSDNAEDNSEVQS